MKESEIAINNQLLCVLFFFRMHAQAMWVKVGGGKMDKMWGAGKKRV